MAKTMARKKKEFAPGENPASLANLTYHEGRPTLYDEPKKRREIVVTQTGWDGFKQVAKDAGLSASELVERIGRELVEIDI